MPRRLAALAPIALLVLAGCGPAPGPEAVAEPPPVATPEAVEPPLDADDPTILRRPFTAEEIRDEWVEGFTLKISQRTAGAEQLQRWRVVAADAEGVDIEYATLDPMGNVVDQPAVNRATWIELRDHASFKADRATREDTTSGELEGWLYRVRDDDAGTVTEYFFARPLPGAPVWMRVTKDGQPVMEMRQLERHRPE